MIREIAGIVSTLAYIEMKSNAQEEIIDLSELAWPSTSSQKSPVESPPAESPPVNIKKAPLEQYLTDLMGRIPESSREGTLHIFIELRHLLKYLDLIEGGIKQEKELQKTISFFELINGRATSLINKITKFTAQTDESSQTLRDTLEGIRFSLQHELRRVFEGEAPGLKSNGPGQSSRSELTRAYGILQNCFQQSTITLAQAFDPTLDGNAIFEGYKVKQEQSVILHRELSLLLQKSHRAEKEAGILQKMYFINSLKQFQQETMHFLMPRDWEEFEGFVKEIIKTYDEMGDLAPVFHRFTSYLETLLKHVSLRTVLNDKPLCTAELTS